MLPIDFAETNIEFGKPAGWTDEECYSIRAYRNIDNPERPYILLAFMPSKEDMEAFAAGRPLMLSIGSAGMPPVALYTFDENGEIN